MYTWAAFLIVFGNASIMAIARPMPPHLWWWDWPLGAVVAGVVAVTLTEGVQARDGGDTVGWSAVLGMQLAAYGCQLLPSSRATSQYLPAVAASAGGAIVVVAISYGISLWGALVALAGCAHPLARTRIALIPWAYRPPRAVGTNDVPPPVVRPLAQPPEPPAAATPLLGPASVDSVPTPPPPSGGSVAAVKY